MAMSDLPDYKQKQKLLYKDDAAPEALIQQGEKFFAAGWYKDAIDFFARAEFTEGLQRIRAKASEEGDAFLLQQCLRAQEDEAPDQEWRELADRALELGKLQFAREAYRQAGDRKGLDKVDAMIAPAQAGPDQAAPDDAAEQEPA